MSNGLEFDEELSRRVEAMYSTPDVVAQRQEVLRALALKPGERVLDIGSGPGLLAHDMAALVASSGRVCGIDVGKSMVAMSQSRCADQPWVEFQVGDATKLPWRDGEFDVAVSTQVYEYVTDVPTALTELHRVLRPGGRALIIDTDWDSIVWNSTDRTRMARILAAWDEHLADPYLPRTLARRLKEAGFWLQRRDVFPLLNVDYDQDTYSYWLIGFVVPFVTGRQGVTEEEAKAWAGDLCQLGQEGSYFFSLNRYLFVATRPNRGDAADRPDRAAS